MVKSALTPAPARLNKGPRRIAPYVPIASVILAILINAFPLVTNHGWFPNFGLLMLLSWRLIRPDVWASWVAAPIGLFNDLLLGMPIGTAMATWPGFMLAMDMIDRRTAFRGYRIEWAIAALFLFIYELAQWRIAAWDGAAVPFQEIIPAIAVSILAFPPVHAFALRLERWRLRK